MKTLSGIQTKFSKADGVFALLEGTAWGSPKGRHIEWLLASKLDDLTLAMHNEGVAVPDFTVNGLRTRQYSQYDLGEFMRKLRELTVGQKIYQ